jgi:glycerol-3-phosphate dehydrogenase (NAD(P)+)
MQKISVVGAGAFGTALSVQLARAGNQVKIWSYEEKVCDEINRLHQNLTYLADIELSENIEATSDLEDAYGFSEMVFLAPPVFALRDILPKEGKNKIFVSASKGIEKDTHKLASEIIQEVVADEFFIAAISGPSFAKEVASGIDTKVVLASLDTRVLESIEKQVATDNFKIELSDDVIGLELGGALKNVLAILAGMASGAGLGKNYQAAVFTEGLREMINLGKRMGARTETFYTVAGLGDLFLTCTSDQSRNFTFGFRLGSGDKIEEALRTKSVIEGASTAESVFHLAQKLGLQTPLFGNVYATIYEAKSPQKALKDIWKAI